MHGVQPRQATETSTDALVEVGEALELGSGRGAAHAVNQAAMPATGAKQAKANLSVVQRADGVQKRGSSQNPMLSVGSNEGIIPNGSPKQLKVALHPAPTVTVTEQGTK